VSRLREQVNRRERQQKRDGRSDTHVHLLR
jgi:hypothetical protein